VFKLEGFWLGVLKFRVETTRCLVGLLGVLKVCVEVMHHPSSMFQTFVLKLHIRLSMF
jgi:hypothetical protein